MANWRRPAIIASLAMLILIGFVLRLLLSRMTVGTNDATTFMRFAAQIDDPSKGLIQTYKDDPEMNHPPLAAYWTALAGRQMQGDNPLEFTSFFKIPMLLADLLGAWLLYDIWRNRSGRLAGLLAAAAFALSLDSILVTGFHCNTDSLCAVLVLLSAWLIDRKGHDFLAGLALAAALNVKLLPLVLIAPMVLSYRKWNRCGRFIAGLGLGLLPFLPIALLAGKAYYRNALAYNSYLSEWGVNQFFLTWEHQHEADPELSSRIHAWMLTYHAYGRYLLLAGAAAIGAINHFRPRWNRYQLSALSMSLFLILAPGFGVQYTVYLVPLLLAIEVGTGFFYSLLAGIFLLVVYAGFLVNREVYFSSFRGPFPQPGPEFGLLTWAFLIWWLTRTLRRTA